MNEIKIKNIKEMNVSKLGGKAGFLQGFSKLECSAKIGGAK